MNWKIITPEKAPDYVLVLDMDNKQGIYAGEAKGADLETAKLIAAAPELLKRLSDIIDSIDNDLGAFKGFDKSSLYYTLAKSAINAATT